MTATVSPIDAQRAGGQTPAPRADLVTLLSSSKYKEGLKQVCGDVLNPERLVKLALFSVNKTPLLQRCTPKSVLGALMLSATFGLEPNTPSQQAFLIPYKKRVKEGNRWVDQYECQFQFGYRGLITLSERSGVVTRLKAEAIREHDIFDYCEGSESFLKFKKNLKRRGELIGAFCFTELSSGADAATVLPAEWIEKVRGRSETFQALTRAVDAADNDKDRAYAEKKLAETPWVLWADEMWAKTAIKKHVGQLPVFSFQDKGKNLLSNAAALDDAADTGIIDMAEFEDPAAAVAAREGDFNTHENREEDAPRSIPHEQTVNYDLGGAQAQQRETIEVRGDVHVHPGAQQRQAPPPADDKPAPAKQTAQAEPAADKAPPPVKATRAAPPPPPADDEGDGSLFGSAE